MDALVLLDTATGWHWWFFPFWILFWVAVVVAVLRLRPWRRRGGRRPSAQEILAERFARGEIDAAEYTDRRNVLSQ
jgi:putative membrane protein